MSDLPAASSALPPPQGEGWTRNKFFFVVAFALALHVALIFIFGTKRTIVPRVVDKVPHLQLADNANEFITLGDPTLFARPNSHDLVTAFWRRTPVPPPPDFDWKEDPRYLPPAPEKFGAAFRGFLQAGAPAESPLNFKPAPKLIPPVIALEATMPQTTTMQITGELARRRLLNPVALPPIPVNDVIAPSKVQALVDTAGNVASAVLAPSDSALEQAGRSDLADSNALVIVRSLRFAPAPRLAFGEITFIWHTVPLTATNAP